MAIEVVTSTGSLGPDFSRSEGRAYYNVEQRINCFPELRDLVKDFSAKAKRFDRRRWVVRAVTDPEVSAQVQADASLPVEVRVPLQPINGSEDEMLILAHNFHRSEVDEWPEVYGFWREPNGRFTQPLARMERVADQGYQFISTPRTKDANDLLGLWLPFGWMKEGIVEQIGRFQANQGWFSGVVDPQTDRLVAACMGEGLQLPGIQIVEGTEYGTAPEARGKGLCTAAVAGLHAQILADTLYSEGVMPMIVAEFNLSSRSDVVGRHVGMTLPLVEGEVATEPRQILKRNVSVLDGYPMNNLRFEEIAGREALCTEKLNFNFRYWRNFIYGTLPAASVAENYSPAQVQAIKDLYKPT